MIKLVLTDLDGTFLNSQNNFDHAFYRKIQALMNHKGVAFAPVTGKQCERVEDLFAEDGNQDLWILGDSATRIKHGGKFAYQSLLPNKIGLKIIETLLQVPDHTIIACTEKAAIISETTPEADMYFVNGSYQVVETVEDYQTITDDFVKITVYDGQHRAYETVKLLAPFAEKAYFVASEAAWIDIANHGVHKGTTVAKLQEILGVTPAETMAFGDGLNDLELFKQADYSFAVKNAFDQTKAAANYVVNLSNDENAVLTTIEKMLNL